MAVKWIKVWLPYESTTGVTLWLNFYLIGGKSLQRYLEDYLKRNPMPEDPKYTEDALFFDLLLQDEGVFTLPDGVSKKTRDYVSKLLDDLLSL